MMARKLLFVIIVVFFTGLQSGCKDKPTSAVFDPSKVASDVHGGHVDFVEPKIAKVNAEIHAGGWAVDSQKKLPAKAIIILVGGKQISISPQMGGQRDDVANALHNKDLSTSGWDVVFTAKLLGRGKHKLEFYALLKDGGFARLLYQDRNYFEIEIIE